MKVLDPQAALLTTSEVHQFLANSKQRPADKKIGAYNSVNVQNYKVVRQDVENYIQTTTPYILKQPPLDQWMKDLLIKLKTYELTKTEVFSLINLGFGLNETPAAGATGTEDSADHNGDDAMGETDDKNDNEEDAEDADSGLDRMLFGLVVEEADERFSGDDGEEKIIDILTIFKETIAAKGDSNGKLVNGS